MPSSQRGLSPFLWLCAPRGVARLDLLRQLPQGLLRQVVVEVVEEGDNVLVLSETVMTGERERERDREKAREKAREIERLLHNTHSSQPKPLDEVQKKEECYCDS